MGGFWANIANTTVPGKDGKRLEIDKVRMQLLQQLLAALLNKYGLETDDGGVIDAAKDAYCTGSVSDIRANIGPLGDFNESGDDVPIDFPNQAATPRESRFEANIEFWDETI